MLPGKKHPLATETIVVDFQEDLSTGETLSSVTTQPTTYSPAANTDLTYGNATINTSGAITPPNGAKSIPQNQGVQFTVAGGANPGTTTLADNKTGTVYVMSLAVTTSSGRVLQKDLELWVSRSY